MTNERWLEVERLYHAARALEPRNRKGWLDGECSGDEALLSEVSSLLAAEPADEWMTSPPARLAADLISRERAALSDGQTIGSYIVHNLVTAGGMGDVYMAEDPRTGGRVALKILRRHLTRDPQAVERFAIEARALAPLRHPNLVVIYEAGHSDAGHFIAMEWVDGRTWRHLIDAGDTGPAIAARLGAQAARALETAHDAGVLHRDIKPENLMLRDDGAVKVLDFGLARLGPHPLFEPEMLGSAGTISGTLSGTLPYMPPEVLRGERATATSDVFSLGVVLYELATGCHPFAGDTPLDVFEAIECRNVAPPSSVRVDVPVEFDALIAGMLDRAPEKRPQAAAVAVPLENLGRQETTSTSATS